MVVNLNPAVKPYYNNYNNNYNNYNRQVCFGNNLTKPEEKGGFREDLSKIAKFFTTLSEMTKATVKGAGYGALTGTVFASGFWLFKALPKGFKKGQSLKNVFKHPLKSIGTKGKIISGAAALLVAAGHIINGKLKSNQRTANVDHQLKTGHRTA